MQVTELKQLIEEYFKTKSQEAKQQIFEIVKTITEEDVRSNDELFNALIPSSGRADTIAGETLRALHKIGYRYYNDGDHYFEGYGIETAGSSAIYLSKHTNQLIAKLVLETIPVNFLATGSAEVYDNAIINTLVKLITLYLRANPTLFISRNTVDSTENYEKDAETQFYEYDTMLNGDSKEDF